MNKSTNNTNANTVQTENHNDKAVNNNLMEEYMMLRKLMKQMKNEPQNTGRTK